MHGYIFRSAFHPDPYWSLGSHTRTGVGEKCLFLVENQQNNHKNKKEDVEEEESHHWGTIASMPSILV